MTMNVSRLVPLVILIACTNPPPPAPVAPAVVPAAALAAAPADPAEAEAAYAAKDWARCARLFAAMAEQATDPTRKQLAHYNAACCHARGGQAAEAFASLDRAIAAGTRTLGHLEQDPDLASLHGDPRWAEMIAAIERQVAALEATLGDPALRRELLALADEDQAARRAMIEHRDDPALAAKVAEIDRKTTARMKQVIARHGWPGKSLVGEGGAFAAWLLVQHADGDHAFQKQCLALIEPMVKTGEVAARNYAYLYDRVAVADGRPQRYGTQLGPDGKPRPIEDPARVDARRKAVGLGTMAEYEQQLRATYGDPARR